LPTAAYLKWLIYIAAYEDRSLVAREKFYNEELAFLKEPQNAVWRGFLYKELGAWYTKHWVSKKRDSAGGAGADAAVIVVNCRFKHTDTFVDPLVAAPRAAAAPGAEIFLDPLQIKEGHAISTPVHCLEIRSRTMHTSMTAGK
jgi:hypothetical protein